MSFTAIAVIWMMRRSETSEGKQFIPRIHEGIATRKKGSFSNKTRNRYAMT
jgi:hypothetical protein